MSETVEPSQGWPAWLRQRYDDHYGLLGAAAEIERLRDYVDGQPCECHDEYGTKRPRQCDRCRLLGKEEQGNE